MTNNDIYAEDIACIFLYCFTNFALAGAFRVLMVYVSWRPCEVIIYKLGIIGSSLIYLIVGFVYYSGKDGVNEQIDTFKEGVINLIEILWWQKGYTEENGLNPIFITIAIYLQR